MKLMYRYCRLGLGLEKHSSAMTAVTTAHPDSMEGKLFRGIVQSGKKRKAEESEITRSPAPVANTANGAASKHSGVAHKSNGVADNTRASDDDDDEESRTKSIKSKASKPPISANNFFHAKATTAKVPSTLPRKSKTASEASDTKQGSAKTSASYAKDTQASLDRNVPSSSAKVSPVKPPYAIPYPQLDPDDADDAPPSPSVDESVITEATESTQAMTTGEAPKKKRKRNKKKKNKQVQPVSGDAVQTGQPDKLFGDSVTE